MAGGRGQIPDTFGTDTVMTLGENYTFRPETGQLRILKAPNYDGFARGFYTGKGNIGLGGLSYGIGLVRNYIPPSWGNSHDAVKVDYTAGYDATNLPKDMSLAVAQLIGQMSNVIDTGGLIQTSISYIDTSESYSLQGLTEQSLNGVVPGVGTIRQILDGYRNAAIGNWNLI